MVILSIVLTHNKGEQGNFDQIEALKSLLTLVTENIDILGNDDQPTGQTDQIKYYVFTDLNIEHRVQVFQIVPFGVKLPSNLDDVFSRKVYYQDETKTGNHPAFFNWGALRGIEGGQVVYHIDNVSKLDPLSLANQLSKLTDTDDPTEWSENGSGILLTDKIIKQVGELDEELSKQDAVVQYKEAIVNSGSTVEIKVEVTP